MIDNESLQYPAFEDGNDKPGNPKVVVTDPEDDGEKAPKIPRRVNMEDEGDVRPAKPKVVVNDPEDEGEKGPGPRHY